MHLSHLLCLDGDGNVSATFLLVLLARLGHLVRSKEDHERNEVEQAPSKLEPEGRLNIGKVGESAFVNGQQTSLDGKTNNGSDLKGDLQQGSGDSGHLRRDRSHDGDTRTSARVHGVGDG